MFRPLALYIGTRYTQARRRTLFVSFISLTSMIGLALGVLVMILVLSVMNGFDQEMRTRILGMVPHITVHSPTPLADWPQLAERVQAHPEVEAVAPFIQAQGLLAYEDRVQKILINAVDPQLEQRVSIIQGFFQQGSLDNLVAGDFGILLGDRAAKALGVQVGDKVTFVAPDVVVTPAGMFPRMKRFQVQGIFHVGAGEIDSFVAVAHVQDLARLQRWQPSEVQGLRLRLHDLFQAPKVAASLGRELGPDFYLRDWTRTHGNLYQAIHMEKTMIGLLLLLIVAVAAFNIISTLVMVVNDKRGDIAILRTLGATPSQIMGIFMVQGTVIGVLGTLMGAVLGVLAALNVSQFIAWVEQVLGYQFLKADVYFIDYLPSELKSEDVALVCIAALVLSFLATLYPAWRASKTQPAQVLRYE